VSISSNFLSDTGTLPALQLVTSQAMNNLLLAYWRHCHYDVTLLHADRQKIRHAWTCPSTMDIGIHCNIRIYLYTVCFAEL